MKDEGFEQQLKDLCAKEKATVCVEAIGGATPGYILNCMGRGATAVVYGLLSWQDVCDVNILKLIALEQRVEGFLCGLRGKSMYQILKIVGEAETLQEASKIRKTYPLAQIAEALEDYKQNMSEGKIIIKPWEWPRRSQQANQ